MPDKYQITITPYSQDGKPIKSQSWLCKLTPEQLAARIEATLRRLSANTGDNPHTLWLENKLNVCKEIAIDNLKTYQGTTINFDGSILRIAKV